MELKTLDGPRSLHRPIDEADFVDPVEAMMARVERVERIMLRVEALLDAVDRHPLARRWLGLP